MDRMVKVWEFPHKFTLTFDGESYELRCNGAFVAYGDSLAPMLKFLGKQLEGDNQ